MASIRFILGYVCLIAIGWSNLPDRSVLKFRPSDHLVFSHLIETNAQQDLVVNIARGELGVREFRNNDGTAVEAYLHYTKTPTGSPWCAAFVSWVFGKAGYSAPKTAWSPSLFPSDHITSLSSPGNVFGLYFPELKRIAHAGIIERRENDWLITIEGNTNQTGSREGDGVYRKRRLVKSIKVYADWLTKKGGKS